ncbi:MAG TPA: L,D-transpeptidase family protein [Thermomicrobiales bacterium]|nr:L,D-transpeptidase family protein [Thermomicrobiales bacterium]
MATHQASAGQAATVVADGVGLMAGIDDPTVIATMYSGERVDVLWGPQNGIYEIRYYGIHGYAWAEHLSLDADGDLAGGTGGTSGGGGVASVGWALVNTDVLNVRGDASTDSAVWDVLGTGASVEVVGEAVNGFVPINYYGSTAWVAARFLSWDGTVTYTGTDAPAEEPAGPPPPEHWIDVDRSSGTVTLFVGDEAQASFHASLGYDTSKDGFNSTAVGTYYVYWKEKGLSYTPYADAYISDWVGFDSGRVNGFHSYTKDKNGKILPNGDGKTAGCVALAPGEIDALFDFATVGMRVEVHD